MMPTATLIFSLPDEEEEYQNAVRGGKFRCVLQDMSTLLRGWSKHGIPDELTDLSLGGLVDHLHDALYGMTATHGVDIYE